MSGVVTGVLQAGKSIWDIIQAKKQKNEFNKAIDKEGVYKFDQNVSDQLSLAKTMLNGRMVGASQAEDNLLASQAGITESAERNSTDASQLLNVLESVSGGTNDALAKLAVAESQDKASRFGQLQGAISANSNELAKVWADKMRMLNMKLGVNSIYHENINNAVGGIADGIGTIASGIKFKKSGTKSLAEFGQTNY